MRAFHWTLGLSLPVALVAAIAVRNQRQDLFSNQQSAQSQRQQTATPTARPTEAPSQTTQAEEVRAPRVATPPTQNTASSRCVAMTATTDPRDALGIRVRVGPTRGDIPPQLNYGTDVYSVWLRMNGTDIPVPPATPANGPLRITVTAPQSVSTRAAFALTVTAENTTNTAFSLLKVNDGSFEHMREPHADLYLQRLSDSAIYRYSGVGGRCGMINSVSADDIVPVAPHGTTRAPFAQWTQHLNEAKIPVVGRYRLWVVYRLCDASRYGALSTGVTVPSNILSDVAISNAVEVEVR